MVGPLRHLSAVFGAFLYLVGCTLRNRLFQGLRRLRHPRYLIGLVLGLGYLWLVFLRPLPSGVAGGRVQSGTGSSDVPLLLTSLGLAALAARWWLFGPGTGALAFAPAEAQFLFPAPLRRRDLLTYKIVAGQVPLLTSIIFFAVVTARWGRTIPMVFRAIALWVLFVTLFLHQLGASLVRVGIAQARPGAKRPFAAIVVFSASGLSLVGALLLAVPKLSAAPDVGGALAGLIAVLQGPVISVVLWPFRAALAPVFAATPAAWGVALGPAVGILIANYVWLLRLDVPFEDAAADASVAFAERLRMVRRRVAGSPIAAPARAGAAQRRPPAWFRLRPTGQPAIAILWKNIVSLQRRGLRGVLLVLIIMVGMTIVTATQRGSTSAVAVTFGSMALGLAVVLALFGSTTFRIDLRQDVACMALLRTYPLSGERIVMAEVASSVLPLTAVQLALVGFACAVFPNQLLGDRAVGVAARLGVLAGAVLVFLALNSTTAIIANATALLFPATRAVGAGVGSSGIEMAGQMFLVRIAGVLALMVALIVPCAAGLVALRSVALVGQMPLAITAGVLACGAALSGQVYLGLRWLGRVFDRTDAVAVSAVD